MIDLNSLLPSGSAFAPPSSSEGALAFATAINDSDQITGFGFVNGEPQTFLLDLSATNGGSTAPEPSTWLLLSGGRPTLVLLRNRR